MKRQIPTCLLLLLLLLAGCNKDSATYTFLVQSETPQSEDGSKTQLVNESLVYWEVGDEIDAWREGGGNKLKLIFQGAGSSPQALFVPEDDNIKFGGNGDRFFTLFPHNDGNTFGSSPTIVFPAEQKYENDNTFGKTACPMVAYGGLVDDDNVVRMLFHNLCGMVRIQLRNQASTGSDVVTLQSIQFTSIPSGETNQTRPLSGNFSVHDYDKYDPYVTGGTNNMVTISDIDQIIGNDLLTFYLPLPAGRGTTEYHLSMRVNALIGSTPYHVTKAFTVRIRRNGVIKMPALSINAWVTGDEPGDNVTVGLVGSGTQQRPFLIYDTADLRRVRDAFNQKNPINGKKVWEDYCYFKIMRSDIILGGSQGCEWTEGIMNFMGSMTNGANQTGTFGIENNSSAPIFESVAARGLLDGIVVRGTNSAIDGKNTFSPLCGTNAGRITNCQVSDNATYGMTTASSATGMAGICVTNSGVVSGSGCRATLNATNVAGICLENTEGGRIVACYTSSPMHTNALRAAGICYENSALVKDCYFASNINALNATEWGGIVYKNLSGGEVKHSYVDASGIIQSTVSIGGIVHTMTGGVVDNCWNEADLMNVQGSISTGGLGGIVYSMQGGEVRNCIRYRPTGSITCTGSGVVGGVVARMSGGAIRNSAFYGDLSQSTVSVKGAFAGNLSGGEIENVYALQKVPLGPATSFYGTRSGNTSFNDCYGQIEVTGAVSVATDAELSSLLNQHSWSSSSSNYLRWDNSEPPMLTTESFSSAKRR